MNCEQDELTRHRISKIFHFSNNKLSRHFQLSIIFFYRYISYELVMNRLRIFINFCTTDITITEKIEDK